jgi:hypothetical protein
MPREYAAAAPSAAIEAGSAAGTGFKNRDLKQPKPSWAFLYPHGPLFALKTIIMRRRILCPGFTKSHPGQTGKRI